METLTLEIPVQFLWGLAISIAILATAALLSVFERHMDPPPLLALRDQLGLTQLNLALFFIALLLWVMLFILLTLGLFDLILDILWNITPKRENIIEVWEFRFLLAQVVALTTVLGAVTALPITLHRLRLQSKSTANDEQKMITERLNSATEQLGSEQLSVRLGAILAFERLDFDSPRDHVQIMEILCAHARDNFSTSLLTPDSELAERPIPNTELQLIITVLGRRSAANKNREAANKFRLDLRRIDFSGCNFSGLDFTGALFHTAKFEVSIFNDCCFRAAQFHGALVSYCDLNRAQFEGSNFANVVFFSRGSGSGPPLSITKDGTKGILLNGARFTGYYVFGKPEELRLTHGDKDTQPGEYLQFKIDQLDLRTADLAQDHDVTGDEYHTASAAVREAGFENWSTYSSHDGATWMKLDKFRKAMGHAAFPYTDD